MYSFFHVVLLAIQDQFFYCPTGRCGTGVGPGLPFRLAQLTPVTPVYLSLSNFSTAIAYNVILPVINIRKEQF
jgi:hypothetical protein